MKFVPLLLTVAIFGWIIYRRVRQNIGPQRLRPVRMIVNMAIMCTVAGLALYVAPRIAILDAVIGLVPGFGLAIFALRHARLEQKPDGMFYTGNLYISLGLTALLIGRIAYRVVAAGGYQPVDPAAAPTSAGAAFAAAFSSAFANPLTAAVLFAAVGYYMTFYVGLLMRSRSVGTSLPLLS